MRSICSNHEVKRDFNLLVSRLKRFLFSSRYFEPGLLPFEIGAGELVVEEELHVWQGLEFVQENFVKISSVGCIVCL